MKEIVCNDGYIMQMQNFSVNDGDGIRTTIFMCGCPLSCIWCCNPENAYHPGNAHHPENMYHPGNAHHPENMYHPGNTHHPENAYHPDTEMPAHAVPATLQAHHMTLDEVDRKISRQALFYRGNGGGITFSGGEATVQQGFLRAMVNRFYDKGYDLSLETCGAFSFDEVKDILQKMSRIFMDLKLYDDTLHRLFTGASNAVILDNIRRTAALSVPVVIRIPVIVGVNAFEENIESTCAFLEEEQASCGADLSLEFLPYHRYGTDKYTALGIPGSDACYERLKEKVQEQIKEQEQVKEQCKDSAAEDGMDFPEGFSFAERMEIPSEELLGKYREIAAAHQIRTVSFR